MKIITIPPKGDFMTNCYVLVSDKNNAVMIDCPQSGISALKLLEEKGYTLKKILLTHGHFDHIDCLEDVRLKTNATVYIHEGDFEYLSNNTLNLSEDLCKEVKPCLEFEKISDGEIIELDELKFETILTNGHTNGSVCYKISDCLFTGDTLFRGSIGRTDLINGNFSALKKSLEIFPKLYNEGDFRIFPGHGERSSLSNEIARNPYLRGL